MRGNICPGPSVRIEGAWVDVLIAYPLVGPALRRAGQLAVGPGRCRADHIMGSRVTQESRVQNACR